MQFLHTTATRASENVKVLSNVSSPAHFLHTLARLSLCLSWRELHHSHRERRPTSSAARELSSHTKSQQQLFILYGNFIAEFITLITQIFTIHQLTVTRRLDVLDTMQISTIERCIKHEIATTKVAQHFTTQYFFLFHCENFQTRILLNWTIATISIDLFGWESWFVRPKTLCFVILVTWIL